MDDQYYRKDRSKAGVVKAVKTFWKMKGLRMTVIAVVPVLSFILFSNRGVIERAKLESRMRDVDEKIEQARREQSELQQVSRALDKDPKALEKVAREKYGMVREGEIVYKVRKEK